MKWATLKIKNKKEQPMSSKKEIRSERISFLCALRWIYTLSALGALDASTLNFAGLWCAHYTLATFITLMDVIEELITNIDYSQIRESK